MARFFAGVLRAASSDTRWDPFVKFRLLLLAAASPLCAAGLAHAETAISTTVTAPVATATAANGARDDIRVTTAGIVQPTGGAAITLNSSNNVTLEGGVKITDANDATGLLMLGGNTGEVKLSGTIQIDESADGKDADSDGDIDGPFATGARRFGVRLLGPGAFAGSITQSTGAINVEGVDSAGISLESALAGAVRTAGAITVIGDRSFGIHAASTVGGEVVITGTVSAQGKDAVGLALDDNVGGRVLIGGAITATGYRYTTRPAQAATAKLDADDLLIGGPAVRIAGDVAGGVVVDAKPADNDTKNTDEDGDGVPDATQSNGAVAVFGSAPAMLIGAAGRDVRLGQTAIGGAGLQIRGIVQADGVYDGVSATGIQLGGLGGKVTVDGGIRVSGQVQASAAKANATALRLGAGALVPSLTNTGIIKATASATDAVDVRAVQVDAGASLDRLVNNGVIEADLGAAKGAATAILDASGSLRSIETSGVIQALVVPPSGTTSTARAIAMDLRANTAGVLVRQSANANDKVIPKINGDVLFGSGPARLELLAGELNGAVAFGAGADALVIDGGGKLTGALTDAGGGLSVDIIKGRLTATNTGSIALTSLNLGAGGELMATADPAAGKSTTFDVAGAATIATGAKIGLRFTSKLTAPETFTLVRAGSLTAGAIDPGLLTQTSWLYKASLRTEGNSILADVRRRTADEAGLNAAEASAYEAVFANFDRDAGLRDALLSKTDAGSFAALYDQFLPDYSGGLFHVLATASDATNRAIDGDAPLLYQDGLRVWTQEIGFIVKRDLARGAGYDATGFGLAGGAEAPDTGFGAVGLQTSFINVDVDEDGAASSESLSGSVISAGLYWRAEGGPLSLDLGVTGGYAALKGKRAIVDVDSGIQRTADSDWNGGTLAGHGNIGWRFDAGPLYLRPHATFDYFMLKEDGRTESGGGEGMNLAIGKRTSQQLGAFAGVTIGARLGEESTLVWAPEVTAGWRQVSGDGVGDTTARFVAGGPAFTLAAPDLKGGGAVVRLALRGQAKYFDLAVEAGGEVRDDYEAYDARLVARVVF
jgi:hypothetical protein